MPVQVLHGIRSNANSLRSILPPPQQPRRVPRLWRHNFRFVLLLLCFLLCAALSINASLLDVTMICWEKPTLLKQGILENQQKNGRNAWWRTGNGIGAEERQWLVWASAIGSLLAALPTVHLHACFGARLVLFWAGLLSALATAAIPLAAHFIDFWALLVARCVQGIVYAAEFSVIGMLCAEWAPLEEFGLFLSMASIYSPALLLDNSFSRRLFCSSTLCWPFIYYSCAFICLALSVAWFAIYTDHPRHAPQVTLKELEHIRRGKNASRCTDWKMPMAMLGSAILWMCWLNAFVSIVPALFLVRYKSIYFNKIFGPTALDMDWLTALPLALHFPLKFAFGMASDRIRFLSERHKLILFNCIGVGLPSFCYLGIALTASPQVALSCFIAIPLCLSAVTGGFYKCAMFNTRQFGTLMMAGMQLNKSLEVFLGPVLVAQLVPDLADRRGWRSIFLLFSAACLANLIFCLVATEEPAEFTRRQRQSEKDDAAAVSRSRSCHFTIG